MRHGHRHSKHNHTHGHSHGPHSHFQSFLRESLHGDRDPRDRSAGRGGGRGPGFFDRLASFGAGGHHGPHGGRGHMRGARMISSEDLQLIILSLLKEKPRHGYELIKTIDEQSSGIYKPSPGMIYPALTYLEETSHAESEADGTKKLFRITKEGLTYLEENSDRVKAITEQLARYGQKMAYFQEQMAQEEDVDARWGGSPKDQDKKEWRQMRSEFQEIRHELKAALFEKLTAPMEEKRRVLNILKNAITEIRKK